MVPQSGLTLASTMLTSFGRYLRDQGATGVDWGATAVPMGVFLVADIVVKLTVVYRLGWLSCAAFVFLLYSLINFLPLVKNMVELVSFYLAYQATHPGTPNPPDELQKHHTVVPGRPRALTAALSAPSPGVMTAESLPGPARMASCGPAAKTAIWPEKAAVGSLRAFGLVCFYEESLVSDRKVWSGRVDSNHRPPGPEALSKT